MFFKGRHAVALVALVLVAGCSTPTDSTTSGESSQTEPDITLEANPEVQELLPASLAEKGEINIVGSQGSPPTSYGNDTGEPEGLNPDIARAIADVMGLEPNISLITTDGIVPGLQSKKYDLAVASMSPSPERLEVLDMVAFTKGGSAIAVPSGNPEGLTSRTLCGLKIGVSNGSYQATHRIPELNEQECSSQGKEDIEVVTLPDQAQALLSLSTNRVDGVMADGPVLAYARATQDEQFDTLEDESNLTSTGGMATLKEGDLTPALEMAMEVLWNSPEYAEIYKKWGMDDYMLPEDELGELTA